MSSDGLSAATPGSGSICNGAAKLDAEAMRFAAVAFSVYMYAMVAGMQLPVAAYAAAWDSQALHSEHLVCRGTPETAATSLYRYGCDALSVQRNVASIATSTFVFWKQMGIFI